MHDSRTAVDLMIMNKTRTQGVCFRDIIYEQNNKNLNVLDHLKNESYEKLREIQISESYNLTAMFLNLCGDLNIGSMIRTSVLSGLKKVIIFGRRKFDARSTVGAEKYIELEIVNGFKGETIEYDLELLFSIIYNNNYVPIYAEHGGKLLGSFSWKKVFSFLYDNNLNPLIIMGNESRGIPEDVSELFDSIPYSFRVSIPQRGVIRSFNVGHAYSAILWDLRKDMGWF